MVQAMEVDSLFGYISIGLYFIIVFFAILIYGFINITARTKELGVLRAIGLQRSGVSQLLVLEMLLLAITSIIPAMVLGGGIAYYYELHPIIIEGIAETYKEYGIVSDAIPTRFDLFTVIWNGGLIFALDLLSVLYPIYYVGRFAPMEAMRHV